MAEMPDPLPPDIVIPWNDVHPNIEEPAHPHNAPPGGGWFWHGPLANVTIHSEEKPAKPHTQSHKHS